MTYYSGVNKLFFVLATEILIIIAVIIALILTIRKIMKLPPDLRKIFLEWVGASIVVLAVVLILLDLSLYYRNTHNASGSQSTAQRFLSEIKYHNFYWVSGHPTDDDLAKLEGCSHEEDNSYQNKYKGDGCIKGKIVIATSRNISYEKVKTDLGKLGLTILRINGGDLSSVGSKQQTTRKYYTLEDLPNINNPSNSYLNPCNSDPSAPTVEGYFPSTASAEEWKGRLLSNSSVIKEIHDIHANFSSAKISPFRHISYHDLRCISINPNASDDQLLTFFTKYNLLGAHFEIPQSMIGLEPAYSVSVPEGQEIEWANKIKRGVTYITQASVIFDPHYDMVPL